MRFALLCVLASCSHAFAAHLMEWRLEKRPPLANLVGPLSNPDHRSRPPDAPKVPHPISDVPFIEHVRATADETDWPRSNAETLPEGAIEGAAVTAMATDKSGRQWAGTENGLYTKDGENWTRHATYGFDGPLSNVIADIAVDSRNTLWVATPAGLSARTADGAWRTIRGRNGLPWEELTAITISKYDEIWLGSTRGSILYTPYVEGRQWYYRAGERYLPGDRVEDVAVSQDGKSVLVKTDKGVGRISVVERTLYVKAEAIQQRFEERHRRLGMPSPARYDNAYSMQKWTHGPQPSDGLWTGYHVAAMSMAYAVTGEDRYRAAAKTGMDALYLLQIVTGIKGLVARSVIGVDEPYAKQAATQAEWHKTADGKYMWRDDVSSDQIDGHYLAFYTYYEHIARHDPAEREQLERQIRQVTDYIVDHNYQIIDWDGERTLWGWYDPERLNNQPRHYLESGLYALMILSHLKVAYYVTGDDKYLEHFRSLIEDHGYLSNLLLEKKLFPDELNHSDDQLSAVAYYPFLQLEQDPIIQETLHRACRRHARIEAPERNTLFAFTYATIDRDDADILGGVQTLREMPLDRRDWSMKNSHRADVVFRSDPNRGGDAVLMDVLPADERHFERWNQDPYEADSNGTGNNEGSGEHYLLPYWMGRYHGLIAAP
ncbi:MAG: hypothetical protein HY706_12635 [Candidatus Hydrogenedentes bacterium]|nr:hypothetical protein [Candidatus Hydrogenedentota bacterium]